MKYAILLLAASLCCAGGNSQEKLKLNPDNATTSGTLIFQSAPANANTMILTCKTAGSAPEDYYDCAIQPGHTLDEVMRGLGRQLENQREGCSQLTKDLLKALPKPIEHDKKNKS